MPGIVYGDQVGLLAGVNYAYPDSDTYFTPAGP